MGKFKSERETMVSNQIARRGVTDDRVLAAMRAVPRHLFVPEEVRHLAYLDCPVQIGSGQTISQPYIVALMTSLLEIEPAQNVLDVGTGSGYQAAILAELAAQVYTIERHPELAEKARDRLSEVGYKNISVHVGDGTQGLEEFSPYDRILVAAAGPSVPEPLLNQLSDGGRLVIPVGSKFGQHLEIWRKEGEKFHKQQHIPVIFVPLVGKYGW